MIVNGKLCMSVPSPINKDACTDTQVEERRRREEEERAADQELAQKMTQQKKQFDDEIKASKVAAKLQKKLLLQKLEQGMKAEARQRFKDQRGMVDEKDRWLHKPVLEGKAPAFV